MNDIELRVTAAGVLCRNNALDAAIKLCSMVAAKGGNATDCLVGIKQLKDFMNDMRGPDVSI